MGSTAIRYRDAEFVANDLPIEVWLLEVVRHIEAGADSWLNALKEDWQLQATAGFGFGPSPALDEFLDSDDRRRLLLSYCVKALEALSRRCGGYTPDELDHLRVGGDQVTYAEVLPTQAVIDVGKKFLALISDADVHSGPDASK